MSSHFENASNFNIEGDTHIYAKNYNHYGERPAKSSIEKLREHIAAGALHNSYERCDAPKCHPETRVAVQGEVVSWICDGDSDDEPKDIMWVTGPAGSGKTAIMGSVADTCQGKGILGATHFFSSFSGSANRRSKRYLVPTLAYQFVQHKSMTRVAAQILSAVERNPAIFEQNLEVQFNQLILEPLRECRDRPRLPEWPKVILIDGLDECEADQHQDVTKNLNNPPPRSREGDQIEILSILKKAASDPDFPFRIVIASRPEHAIKRFLGDVAKSLTRELFLDAKYNPDADMALFLESKFANIRRESHLPSSWPGEDVRQSLIANASGQFIYVATVGRFMEVSGGDPDELLKQVLRLPGFKASTDALAPLDALYTHILKSSPDPPLTMLWLNVIFREKYLEKPPNYGRETRDPTATLVRLFLESYPGQASYTFRNLNSLVSIPSMENHNSPYRLYHKSLVDFLQERSRSGALYVESKVVLRHFVDRYFHLWKSRGPERSLTPHESQVFFDHFFLCSIISKLFSESAEELSRLDTIILSCDAAWWVQRYLKVANPWLDDKISVNYIFCGVHATVSAIV
ncbi:hypothetical protein EST38_g12772 [Candolleomyces aberdarensis]|uniref:Nephrocystin 3-like N-terminal domain-containing protein n=1 Tax=Candolleomyces aberdarensis TaxID=2316362 RepID=A0A4Q2D1L0_9AGAR|nr:hypothetical protein EST38_g12772 [Candolleomyces aberdarensis]